LLQDVAAFGDIAPLEMTWRVVKLASGIPVLSRLYPLTVEPAVTRSNAGIAFVGPSAYFANVELAAVPAAAHQESGAGPNRRAPDK